MDRRVAGMEASSYPGSRNGPGEEEGRIRGPLFLSAAAHVLMLSIALAPGAVPADVPFRGVMDVFLVGAGAAERAPAGIPSGGTTGAADPAAAARPSSSVDAVPPSPAADASGPERAAVESRSPAVGEEGGRPFPGPDTEAKAGERIAGVGAEREYGERARPPLPAGAAGDAVPGKGSPSAAREEGGGADVPGAPQAAAGAGAGPAPTAARRGGFGDDPRPAAGTALLRARIQSRIVYPEEAVRRGQEGDVLLRILIGTGGVPGEIRVARSSGAPLLDEAARRGVVRAAPLPSEPGWVEVPVFFRLR